MPEQNCRWGIISTALIGQKNWQAIKKSGNGIVAGVASRDASRANQFIDSCQQLCPFEQRPHTYDDYQSLLADEAIDAVYLPLPTGMRKEWVIRAANAGKHVLCEKPCAPNAHDLEEMIDACRQNGVQFMDGVMYMHGNRLPKVREILDDESNVGDLKRITCQFSFCAPQEWLDSDIRLNSDLEPQGCLGDLGWYCIRFALWTMNWQMPNRVTATILSQHQRQDSPEPVPVEFSAELFFPGNVTANFYCSFITHHQQWANISGTKGYLHLQDFVLPYQGNETRFDVSNAEFVVDGCDFYMQDHRKTLRVEESGNSSAFSQETNLFRNFAALALSGKTDEHWPNASLKTQQVLDACLNAARNENRVAELIV